jgi:hypothetical protein
MFEQFIDSSLWNREGFAIEDESERRGRDRHRKCDVISAELTQISGPSRSSEVIIESGLLPRNVDEGRLMPKIWAASDDQRRRRDGTRS